MTLVLYAAHGLDKEGNDTGGFDGESYYNLAITLALWQHLADQNIFSLMPRPSDGAICSEKLKRVSSMGELVVEIHTSPALESVSFEDYTGPGIPTLKVSCPSYDLKDWIHGKTGIAAQIASYLYENHSEVLKTQQVKATSPCPPCRSAK